jgi:hypothetical protein
VIAALVGVVALIGGIFVRRAMRRAPALAA